MKNPKNFVSNSPEESKKFAQDFAEEILAEGRARGSALVVALYGDLGSGKTTFAQGFAEALGIEEKTKSPTFVITKKYQIQKTKLQTNSKFKNSNFQKNKLKFLYHFDVYRIHNEKEILNLGWEEIISNPENIVLVEWADKIEKILPKNCVRINFKHLAGDKRKIIVS